MLKSAHLKDNINNIGIDQSLSNRGSFEHKFVNNIKKIYQHAGKCDDQHNFKYIIGDAMVSTSQEITDDSPSLIMSQTTVKKTSARKSLCLFTNIFYVKKISVIRCFGAAKSKRRANKSGCRLCTN